MKFCPILRKNRLMISLDMQLSSKEQVRGLSEAQVGHSEALDSNREGLFIYIFNRRRWGAGFDFGGGDPFEIFEQFFGGASPFGRQRRQAYSLTIDFLEAVHGTTKKVEIGNKSQTIKIPAGVDEGSRIRFGDYDVVVSVTPDKTFQREGFDIVGVKEIPFALAALGGEVNIETIDGNLKLRIPGGTQPGTAIRLREKGVPHLHGSGRGDHYVRIKVTVPKHLTGRQKELLKEFMQDSKSGWF